MLLAVNGRVGGVFFIFFLWGEKSPGERFQENLLLTLKKKTKATAGELLFFFFFLDKDKR